MLSSHIFKSNKNFLLVNNYFEGIKVEGLMVDKKVDKKVIQKVNHEEIPTEKAVYKCDATRSYSAPITFSSTFSSTLSNSLLSLPKDVHKIINNMVFKSVLEEIKNKIFKSKEFHTCNYTAKGYRLIRCKGTCGTWYPEIMYCRNNCCIRSTCLNCCMCFEGNIMSAFIQSYCKYKCNNLFDIAHNRRSINRIGNHNLYFDNEM